MLDNAVIASALVALAASIVGMALTRRSQARESQLFPASAPGASLRVPAAESRPVRPSPRSEVGRVPSSGQSAVEAAEPVFRCYLSNHAHAVEFVEWMRAMGFVGLKSPTADIIGFYGWWTHDARVFPIDDQTFLTALGKLHGRCVTKKRARAKSAETGKVIRRESGSPVRPYFYTINEAEAVHVPTGAAAPSRSRPRAKATGHSAIVIGHEIDRRAA